MNNLIPLELVIQNNLLAFMISNLKILHHNNNQTESFQ